MNVLLTHERFAPDFGGGGEYVVLETARGLIKRGVNVRVLTTGDPANTSYEGIPTTRLPITRYRFNAAVRDIAKNARDTDLIQTFTYHAAFPSLAAARWTNKPIVCLILGLFQDAWKDMKQGPSGRFRIGYERFLLRRGFDRFIFISPYSKDIGVSLGAPADRSVVNCPGIELENYSASTHKEDVVLFVGKLDVRKGVNDILEAARALPNVRFEMYGWGENMSDLRAQATSNVTFTEFQRGAPLADAFARSRIFVLPTRAETFGIALVEAMASGCAVISTIPLEFEGVRLQPGDQQGLVEGIRRLWDDRNETARMGRRNAELAQSYTWDRFTDSLLNTYEELLVGR